MFYNFPHYSVMKANHCHLTHHYCQYQFICQMYFVRSHLLAFYFQTDMGVEKTQPRRPINKKNKTTVVFDENARKEFLTGFRKRKDERRKQWKEKVERQLKNEMKKIKAETKLKVRHTSFCEILLQQLLDISMPSVTYSLLPLSTHSQQFLDTSSSLLCRLTGT